LDVQLSMLRAAAEAAASSLNQRALSRASAPYYPPLADELVAQESGQGSMSGGGSMVRLDVMSSVFAGFWGAGAGGGKRGGEGGGGAGTPIVVAYMSSDIKLSHPIGQLLLPVLQGHISKRTLPMCIDSHAEGLGRSKAGWQLQVL
jgi:hypothetical protein